MRVQRRTHCKWGIMKKMNKGNKGNKGNKDSCDISVILPVYNSEEYIEEAFESILRQEGVRVETILIDDGSTDRSGKILDRYAAGYDSVHVIHQENKGISAARNAGLETASGKYITYLDSDDMFADGALKNAFDKCEENALDAVIFSYVNFFDDEAAAAAWKSKRTGELMLLGEYPDTPITGPELLGLFKKQNGYATNVWLQLARRSFLAENDIRFSDGIIFEDAPYTLSVLLNAKRVMACRQVMVRRRIRNDSIEHSPATPDRCRMILGSLEPLTEIAKSAAGCLGENAVWAAHEIRRQCLLISRFYSELSNEEKIEFKESCSEKELMIFTAFIEPYADKAAQADRLKVSERKLKGTLEREKEKNSQLKDKTKALREQLKDKNTQVDRWRQEARENRQEIKRLRSSMTFRTGKLIIGALSKIKRIIKRRG